MEDHFPIGDRNVQHGQHGQRIICMPVNSILLALAKRQYSILLSLARRQYSILPNQTQPTKPNPTYQTKPTKPPNFF